MPRALRAGAVRALPAGGRFTHRRVLVREWARDRFWVVPSVFLVLGCGLAILTEEAAHFGLPLVLPDALGVTDETADSILGVVASSMLTFVGVVFTITLVALQLASAQLSPRVIRTFVRSSVTKLAFGIFLATFTFSLTALAMGDRAGPGDGGRAVVAAGLLLAASLVIFVVYVTSTMKLLQVGWVITAVADETRAAIAREYPAPHQLVSGRVRETQPDQRRLVRLSERGERALGVIRGVDRARLVDLARRYDVVVELVPRVGQYVTTHEVVLAVHGARMPPARQLLNAIDLGRNRTMYQDPAFGLRQLADVGTQALSAALNQPTTASQVLDRMADLLLRIAHLEPAPGRFVDADGVVRLLVRPITWDELVDLAFVEITVCGASSPQITRRLLAVYDQLERECPAALRPPLLQRRALLVDKLGPSSAPVHRWAAHPDPMGLG